MMVFDGKDFVMKEAPPRDENYEKQCCEQCDRIRAAYARKRGKPITNRLCGTCMGYLSEDVLRVLSALDAPCRYCGDVPWVSLRPRKHVTISCENDECACYMSTDKDGKPRIEAEAIERWNYLNTGKPKAPKAKAAYPWRELFGR
jgi:hypothetical protein